VLNPAKILEHLQGLVGKDFKVKVINVDERVKNYLLRKSKLFQKIEIKL